MQLILRLFTSQLIQLRLVKESHYIELTVDCVIDYQLLNEILALHKYYFKIINNVYLDYALDLINQICPPCVEIDSEISSNLDIKSSIKCYQCYNFAQINLNLITQIKIQEQLGITIFEFQPQNNLELLLLIQARLSCKKIIFKAIGEGAELLQLLAPLADCNYSYYYLQENLAQGAITLIQLEQIYQIKRLNHSSKIYFLIGDPVNQSIGELFHNKIFIQQQENSLYLKLKITIINFAAQIKILKQLAIVGLSVTMPHKRIINQFIDDYDDLISQKLTTINTITVINKRFHASNSDGLAAQQILNQYVNLKNLKILIFGAGGVARAIAYQLYLQKSQITIVNRSQNNAQALAELVQGNYFSLAEFNFLSTNKSINYEVIINTLTKIAYAENLKNWRIINAQQIVALDVVYNEVTTFLDVNPWKLKISGDEFYKVQALEQQRIWHYVP